jgi:hypothetical protein
MKQQSRILKNGSKPAAASQATNKPNPAYVEMARLGKSLTVLKGRPYLAALDRIGVLCEQEMARLHPAGTVTCVWTAPNGREWMRVKFEGELFARIEIAASTQGITLQHFFDNAIRHYCDSQDSRRAA